MSTTPLIKKLRLQTGQKALILNNPSGYMELLGELPSEVEIILTPGGKFDFVHLFVKEVAELNDLAPIALDALVFDGILWISYPKKSSKIETDITRDKGWDIIFQAGFRPVTQISIDEIWSALRFRPVERVGK